MNIDSMNPLNEMDCTFYFILKGEDKTLMFNEEAQRRLCEKFASITDVELYGMRSGPNVRSAKALQEEFKGTIPEQIKIIFVDREQDEVSLLSNEQRDLFSKG